MGERRCATCRVLNLDTEFYCDACGRPLWSVESPRDIAYDQSYEGYDLTDPYEPARPQWESSLPPSWDASRRWYPQESAKHSSARGERYFFDEVKGEDPYLAREPEPYTQESTQQWEQRVRRDAGYPPVEEDIDGDALFELPASSRKPGVFSSIFAGLSKVITSIPMVVKILVPAAIIFLGLIALIVVSFLKSGEPSPVPSLSPSVTETPLDEPTHSVGPLSITPQPGWDYVETTRDDLEYRSSTGSFTLRAIHLASSELTPQQYVEASRGLLETSGFTVSKLKDAKAAGFGGWEYSTTTPSSHTLTVFLVNGQSLYQVGCTLHIPDPETEVDEGDCRTMMNSLKISR